MNYTCMNTKLSLPFSLTYADYGWNIWQKCGFGRNNGFDSEIGLFVGSTKKITGIQGSRLKYFTPFP